MRLNTKHTPEACCGRLCLPAAMLFARIASSYCYVAAYIIGHVVHYGLTLQPGTALFQSGSVISAWTHICSNVAAGLGWHWLLPVATVWTMARCIGLLCVSLPSQGQLQFRGTGQQALCEYLRACQDERERIYDADAREFGYCRLCSRCSGLIWIACEGFGRDVSTMTCEG